jgi:xeroderma pigmentosum group C-complementing protein
MFVFRNFNIQGKVPKNERGQVDLWADCLIPVGVVHLEQPRMSLLAKKLGIDYAPAMLGFEVRKRHSIPNIKGIVVCEEFKDILVDAFNEAEKSISFQISHTLF